MNEKENFACYNKSSFDTPLITVDAALFTYQDGHLKILLVERSNQMSLAFDHLQIINTAHDRLIQKALYSIIPAYALPKKFTLPELQQVHEVIISKPLQKKSFRRRIEQADLLIDTGEKRTGRGRPATPNTMHVNSRRHTFVRNLEL
ncbi:hypothetical protein [uncultured Microbulbifer sp.]|uniref:NrtR DNA-binding winged helix domain-containing protein n=1 Tax=uncultured Microbulbifer sp. TaxID=348147 RepID=UPI00262D3A29|nr:hypothetical protein [uncultured Microbulbifer sp.]